VETIRGDRYRDLDKLAGRKWDAVIDTCGYIPQNLKASAETLAESIGQYVFISSISAYADFSNVNFDETAPPAVLNEEQQKRADAFDLSGEVTAFKLKDLYGGLKAACEQVVAAALPGRALIIRPGLIVGAYDSTDRFTYWVTRIAGAAKGGEILAPGSPDRFVQLIDAQDLAEWTIAMIERGETGIYNVTGKPFDLTMERMLNKILETSESNASFIWADEDFLTEQNVKPWSEMPLYLPESDEGSKGFLLANIDQAIEKGLKFRPLKETIVDTLKWANENLAGKTLKAGITAEREAELLKKLKVQSSSLSLS
jgi:2'-hydroxyisoflavone reductase